MKKAIIYTLAYLAIQLIGSTIVLGIMMLIEGKYVQMTAPMMIVAMTIAAVTTLGVFLYLHWAEVSRSWLQTRPWTVLAWCCVAALGAIIPSVWLQEQMPELPNLAEQQLDMIMKDRWGYFAVGILAPVAEELVFRGAVLRALLRWKEDSFKGDRRWAWGMIALSAVFFSLVHGNPAQMPHAFLIGLLMGWMYWRTGSIIPGVAYHWINNSVAYVMYNLYPDPSMKLADLFGGSQQHVLMAVGFSLLILLPALYQLNLWMKRAML